MYRRALPHAIVFENVAEQLHPISLRVKGQIPTWLTGSLFRTGPGTFRVPIEQSSSSPSTVKNIDVAHWFDGLGMNHHFRIHEGGLVTYQSRSSTTSLQKFICQKARIPGVTFGEKDPCQSIFSKFFTLFTPGIPEEDRAPDGVNAAVTLTQNMPGFPSRIPTLMAKTDANVLQLIDANSLEPIQITSYSALDPRLEGPMSAAHSCRDQHSGDFYNFVLSFASQTVYKVFRLRPLPETADNGCQVDVLAEIDDAPAAYLHSFAMTEKYLVLCVWQADYSFGGLSIPLQGNIASSIKPWNFDRKTFFYVIDRHQGGVVSRYQAPPFFAFHLLNAFDDDDNIIIDISVYDDLSVIDALYLENLRNMDGHHPMIMGHARRFVLPNVASSGTSGEAVVSFTIPQEYCIELPTINPLFSHKPYRYAYGISRTTPGVLADKIVKLDMSQPKLEHKMWGAPGYTVGEPIFVPKPTQEMNDPSNEDSGVILTVVLDAEAQKSMLVILDSKDMSELARAEMETVFPYGFHGTWVESS